MKRKFFRASRDIILTNRTKTLYPSPGDIFGWQNSYLTKWAPLANFLGPPPAVKWEEVDRTFELEPPQTQILATPLAHNLIDMRL